MSMPGGLIWSSVRPALFLSRCIILALILSACAQSPKYLSEMDRKSLGHVGVVSAQFQPEINLTLPAKGAGAGAWRGAKEGAKDVIVGSAVIPLPGTIILGILLSPVAAAGGAIYGAFAAPPAKTVVQHEKVLTDISQKLEINRSIREGIIRYADKKAHYLLIDLGETGPAKPGKDASYLGLALNGTDTVLEVIVSDLSTQGAAINSPFKITINVDVRMIRTVDDMVLASYPSRFVSQPHTLQEWASHDGSLFREVLQKGFTQISRETMYELLFIYDAVSAKEMRSVDPNGKGYVHPPEIITSMPEKPAFSLFSDNRPVVGTVTPEFCWKPFISEKKQLSDESAKMSGVSHISYQLEVRHDDEMVYKRESLKGLCHHLDQPLKWNEKYSVSVRRWFKLNGYIRVTRPGEVLFKTPSIPASQ